MFADKVFLRVRSTSATCLLRPVVFFVCFRPLPTRWRLRQSSSLGRPPHLFSTAGCGTLTWESFFAFYNHLFSVINILGMYAFGLLLCNPVEMSGKSRAPTAHAAAEAGPLVLLHPSPCPAFVPLPEKCSICVNVISVDSTSRQLLLLRLLPPASAWCSICWQGSVRQCEWEIHGGTHQRKEAAAEDSRFTAR